jgi:hypothetical protein
MCNAKQVTQACREAIAELGTMIPKIHASYNVTEVYETSDHGFLFNDIGLPRKTNIRLRRKPWSEARDTISPPRIKR